MTKRKAGFYGVRVGRTPGVYEDWESCESQVKGFPHSKYQKFGTRAEAEKFVHDISPGPQVTTVTCSALIQTQTLANHEAKQRHSLLPATTSKRNPTLHFSDKVMSTRKETASPSRKVTNPKEEFSPSKKVTDPKEEVISFTHPLTKNLSEFFKLVEENGQQFVFFESLERFDSYFENLCRTRHSSRPFLESISKIHEIRTKNQTSDSDVTEQPQTKVDMEDDEFLYFKNEDDLKDFLEPYFKNAKQASYSQNGMFQLEFDGASKGNPGRAGAGALIRCPHGSVVMEVTEFLGIQTNNFAEYQALILGLRAALSKGIRRVRAQGDSQLVCMQVTGVWKIGNEKLLPLHGEVKKLEKLFEEFSIAHIRREYNSEADALANEAVVHGEAIREVVKPQPECCS